MEMGTSLKRDDWIKDLVIIALENGEDINATNKQKENVIYRAIKKIRTDDIENIKPSIKFFLSMEADPLMKIKFTHRGKYYNALEAFCLDMNRLSWNERNKHPKICKPRNINAFNEFF